MSEVKKLSMAKIMSGLEELLDPESSTEFLVTLQTGAKLLGEVEWLRAKLPEWQKILNAHSGARVITAEVDAQARNKWTSHGTDERGWSAQIKVKMMLAGMLREEKIQHSTLRKKFSGIIKGILACQILEMFPPPFDVVHPCFQAGRMNQFEIRSHKHNGWTPEETRTLAGDEFTARLHAFLEEYGADLVRCTPIKKLFHPCILIVTWRRDVDKHHDRFSMRRALEKFLEENNIRNIGVEEGEWIAE